MSLRIFAIVLVMASVVFIMGLSAMWIYVILSSSTSFSVANTSNETTSVVCTSDACLPMSVDLSAGYTVHRALRISYLVFPARSDIPSYFPILVILIAEAVGLLVFVMAYNREQLLQNQVLGG